MIFRDLKLTDTNHFVAMEYYLLMLNRTFLIVVDKEFLFGIKVNGLISIEAGDDPIAKSLSRAMAVRGNLGDPNSYIKAKYIKQIEDIDLTGPDFLKVNKSNFRIRLSDIEKVFYDPKKKWGMGYYPHDGKVYIKMKSKKKREFIILGRQLGKVISSFIEQAAANAHNISLLQ